MIAAETVPQIFRGLTLCVRLISSHFQVADRFAHDRELHR
jgi:hypothetical protein